MAPPNTLAKTGKPFMTGCCTCGRLLKIDGTLTEAIVCAGGIFDMQALLKLGSDPEVEQVATFASRTEAEVRLLELGFSVEGGNHRCPRCTPQYQQRPGLMIDLREVFA
jgi:hypothetical protein